MMGAVDLGGDYGRGVRDCYCGGCACVCPKGFIREVVNPIVIEWLQNRVAAWKIPFSNLDRREPDMILKVNRGKVCLEGCYLNRMG